MNTTFSESEVRELVEVRRDLHAHPETAFTEVRTSGIVAERLRAMGLEPRTQIGKTGVIADLRGKPGRSVLLRADMDALPIVEENDVPYRSLNPGQMHACGHDCHTSALLGIAKRMVRERDALKGTVRFVFQPAEEQGGGAKAMIAEGALEPRPEAAFGIHVWQDLDLGQVAVTPGPFMAAVDEFNVTITGVGAHAAMPQASRDPVVCAAHVITALQTLVSRNADPLLEAVVSVTQVHAGTAFNIIPLSAHLNGTVRLFDRELWEQIPGHFERVIRGVTAAFGCTAEIEYIRHNLATENDPAMAALAHAAAVEVVGEANVRRDVRTMGGEDFSFFLREVPGCFIAVGSRNVSRNLVYGHHHPRFDVDEKCLEIGAEVLLRTARKFLSS